MKKRAYVLLAGFSAVFFCLLLAQPSPAPADDDETITSGMVITPFVLNLKSKGKFITAHISLPEGSALPAAEDIQLHLVIADADTGSVTALHTGTDVLDLLNVKFSRADVQSLIGENYTDFPATVPLSVTIASGDNETLRYTESIRVIKPGKKGKGNGNGNGKGNGRDE